jgi:hypothetical protein
MVCYADSSGVYSTACSPCSSLVATPLWVVSQGGPTQLLTDAGMQAKPETKQTVCAQANEVTVLGHSCDTAA